MERRSTIFVSTVVFAAVVFAAMFLPVSQLQELTVQEWRAVAGFALLALLAQLAAIDFMSGRQARSSLAFIPLLAGAMVLPPSATLLTAVPVIAISEAVSRRHPMKALFNVAQITLAVGIGAHAYAWWLSVQSVGHLAYVGAILLVAIFFATNIVLSSIALAMFGRAAILPTFLAVVGPRGSNLFYDMLSSPFVIIAVAVYTVYGVGGMFLLVLPMLMLRHGYAHRQKLEHANRDLLYALVKAIETRDPYTSGHSRRVATLARLIAKDYGLSSRKIERVTRAALLHDIGKIDPELSHALRKPHALTPEERRLIETHSERGAELLRDLGSMEKEVVAAVRHHHERYDGRGYPDGIAGTDIPLEARIIMLSDSIDAMLSDRPYRRALRFEEVSNELTENRGSQFDPELVAVVLENDTLRKAEASVAEWRQSNRHGNEMTHWEWGGLALTDLPTTRSTHILPDRDARPPAAAR
jgi:putative nucleotidyltransferase with HDIG domain